ncbi:superinfection immunity protein [Pseudomonas syringae pv. actinidiae]|nr:superinfection immunity protein [Pseudomonas syringae pv. actinidiae]
MQTGHGIVYPLIGFLIFMLFYFAPALNARSRKHPNYPVIFLVNLLLGWTLVGWFVAAMWSASSFKRSENASSGHTFRVKYSQLEALGSLKEKGLITDEEFESEKGRCWTASAAGHT